MRLIRLLASACAAAVASASSLHAQVPAVTPPAATGVDGAPAAPPAVRRAPRPYAQVITARAHTVRGRITVHKVDDRYFFEVPDSLLARDFLMVTRVAGVPAGSGGFQSAGSSLNEPPAMPPHAPTGRTCRTESRRSWTRNTSCRPERSEGPAPENRCRPERSACPRGAKATKGRACTCTCRSFASLRTTVANERKMI